MRITTITKGITIALFLLVGMLACKKSSDLILSPDQLDSHAAYLVLDSKGNDTLFLNNPSKPVTLNVHVYGQKSVLVTVYVSTNNSIDSTTWRKLGEFPVDANGKASLSTTPAQIAAALGRPIPNGAEYTLYNKVTTDGGRTFSLANTNTDFEASAAYNMALRWKVFAPCSWDNTPFSGDAIILEDKGWQDYSTGEVVPNALQPGPGPNQIQIRIYPSPAYGTNPQWVIVDVDPNTLKASIIEQPIGNYGSVLATMKTSAPGGKVNPCTGIVDLRNVMIGYGSGSYGPYTLIFKTR